MNQMQVNQSVTGAKSLYVINNNIFKQTGSFESFGRAGGEADKSTYRKITKAPLLAKVGYLQEYTNVLVAS